MKNKNWTSLEKEWHASRNEDLMFCDVSPGSSKKVWWRCLKKREHVWQASPSHRSRGQGCPFCSGRRASQDNCLATSNPKIAAQWHPIKNDGLTPLEVTPSSNRQVWWICQANDEHEWKTSVNKRTAGRNCPFCAGKKVCRSNSLAALRPDLAKKWHKTKNGDLTPFQVTSMSGKKIWWQCENDSTHEWQSVINSRPANICPFCENERHINTAKEIASKHGGELLSSSYKNNREKLKWRCSEGHEWQAVLSSVKNGSWCPDCSKNQPKTIRDMHQLAESLSKGISIDIYCVSRRYVNSKTKLSWKCSNGHTWKETYSALLENKKCLQCYPPKNQKITIEEVMELARLKKGRLISTSISNIKEKLTFECEEGHIFTLAVNDLKHGRKGGHWCAQCAGNARKTLDDMKDIAISRGGQCLSERYKGSHIKLEWECSEKHTWFATYNNIRKGSWCPQCRLHLGEELTRCAFSQLFETSFPKKNPDWLKGLKDRNLELDGYSEELKLAFEHQGLFHYEVDGYMVRTEKELAEQKKRDAHKKKLCHRVNVVLIEIPEVPRITRIEALKDYILDQCKKAGVNIPKGAQSRNIKYTHAYMDYNSKNLEKLRMKAKANGGKILTDFYSGMASKYEVECANKHTWSPSGMSIMRGSWCPHCSGHKNEYSYQDKQAYAETNGMTLVTTKDEAEELTSTSPMKWICPNGHTWTVSWQNVRRSTCPTCLINADKNAKAMQYAFYLQIAETRQGKLLSKSYSTTSEKLHWECSKKHRWWTTPENIKQGKWCPECGIAKSAEARSLSLKDAHEEANKHGGRCLSKEYKNTKNKMKWTCANGHVWLASFGSIRNGTWCPSCQGNASKSLSDVEKIAKLNGGRCLESTYSNNRTPMQFECDIGHLWTTTAGKIFAGRWCPECGRKKAAMKRRGSIEDIKIIAKDRKGKCLSDKYEGNHVPLDFRCNKGHTWKARPSSIKRGTWCPICSRSSKR